MKIAEEVEPVLSRKESENEKGSPLSIEELDAKWAAKNGQQIIYRLSEPERATRARKKRLRQLRYWNLSSKSCRPIILI